MENYPTYPHGRIQTVQSLCAALGEPEPKIRAIAARAHNLYIGPKPKPKKNGGTRYVFDTKSPLKPLLKKINYCLFRKVIFPKYLTGSISRRDFIANVEIHSHSKHVVTEDIASFFDCITTHHVYRVWREFFGFGREVAELLTLLTTKDGKVFQGTPTSSYLANLVFWDKEHLVVAKLAERGIRYSRYVDDITLSTVGSLTAEDRRWAIGQVYAMIGSSGFKPQRGKHASLSASKPILIMGVHANQKPTFPKQERAAIRAQVYQLEKSVKGNEFGDLFERRLQSAAAKVGKLKRLHPTEAAALKLRLNTVRRKFGEHTAQPSPQSQPTTTVAEAQFDNDPPF